jgi:hypothetical protein
MVTPSLKLRLSAEQRRALELLNRSQGRCTRALWAAYGFTLSMLVDLIRDGLADLQAETVSAGGRTTEIVRLRITAAGWRAIEGTAE